MRMIGFAIASLLLTATAWAQNIAITNGRVVTNGPAGTIENGTVVISNGRVTAVGPSQTVTAPAGARVIDAAGAWVTPGVISAYSQTGLVEVGAEDSTNDRGTGSDFSVFSRASDGFDPARTTIGVTRIEGVTGMIVGPNLASGSIFGGQGFFASTSGAPGSITRDGLFVYADLGNSGAGRSGGSRAGSWAFLRAAFGDARNLALRYASHSDAGDALNRLDAQALGNVTAGRQLLLIHVEKASDILKVIELARENPTIRIAILGASEGWIVADQIAASGIPVIINPFQNLPSGFDQLGSTMQNANRLHAAGARVAYFYADDDTHQARLVLQAAGNAVANGVDWNTAFRAITLDPAEIFGLPGYGLIAPGAVADIVIWDGDPLEVTTAPTLILIGGEEQSLESRQTKLRDRYLDLERAERPLSYNRP